MDGQSHVTNKVLDRATTYEVPSFRHINDKSVINIKSLKDGLISRNNNKQKQIGKRFHRKSSTENRKRKKADTKQHTKYAQSKNRFRESAREKLFRESVKQKVVTLPGILNKSLLPDSSDHGFGISKRGVAEAELFPSKHQMTPHLPRRYIENILKLNIWNSNNTIKVNPTSTELGRNWRKEKPRGQRGFEEHMVASEFSSEHNQFKSSRIAGGRKQKAIATESSTKHLNHVAANEPKPQATAGPNIVEKKKEESNGDNRSIEVNLQHKHNVSKSDIIQLRGIHIMFSSLKQNLSSVLPTLHITASVPNATKEGTPNTSTPFPINSDNAASFETLVGTAVMKNGHLYLVVYPFGQDKSQSLNYRGTGQVPFTSSNTMLSSPSNTSPHNKMEHKPTPSMELKQNQGHSHGATEPMAESHHGHQEMTSRSIVAKSIEKQSTTHMHHSGISMEESTSHGLMGHAQTSHHEVNTAMAHHAHSSHHGAMDHSGHSDSTTHASSGGIKTHIERFMSPWKQTNLSNILPYIEKNKPLREEDDSSLKLVSFVAEATDPFVEVRKILGSLKNASASANDTNVDISSVNYTVDPAVDATFNFELKIQGANLSNALNLDHTSSIENASTDFAVDIAAQAQTTPSFSLNGPDGQTSTLKMEISNHSPTTNTFQAPTTVPLKITSVSDTMVSYSDTTTSPSTTMYGSEVLKSFPSIFGDGKENDLYETIDSVIMQKMKTGNTTDIKPTSQTKPAPNVTLEALGISKESLQSQMSISGKNLSSTKITNITRPIFTSTTSRITTTEKTTMTQPATNPSTQTSTTKSSTVSPQTSYLDTNVSKVNTGKGISSQDGRTNYDVHINDKINTRYKNENKIVKAQTEPVISLADVLSDIRKIQLQNSVRFNKRNSNFDTNVVKDVKKVSNRQEPVLLEGPLYGDFMTTNYQKSTDTGQGQSLNHRHNDNSYKNWNQQAVRHALDAMLVLSVDDILADHTTLHGTIVMAQNKDQSKDSSGSSNR